MGHLQERFAIANPFRILRGSNRISTLTPNVYTVETHGDTGIAWGQFKLLAEPVAGGDPVEMLGRYTDVSRNVDGSWLYILDHVSMVPPAAEE